MGSDLEMEELVHMSWTQSAALSDLKQEVYRIVCTTHMYVEAEIMVENLELHFPHLLSESRLKRGVRRLLALVQMLEFDDDTDTTDRREFVGRVSRVLIECHIHLCCKLTQSFNMWSRRSNLAKTNI